MFATVAAAWGDPIFVATDPILGGQRTVDTTQFLIGIAGTTPNTNNWPTNESPNHAIDGVAQKYLNFGITNTGFLVDPAFNGGNGSVVTSMQLWTANDAEPRDPSTYEIWGTNTDLDFGLTAFDMSQFTLVSSGALALPAGRGSNGTNPLNNTNSQTVTFVNSTGYKEYLVIFPSVKNTPTAANSMQIGEVQLFGIPSFIELKWNGNVNNVWNVNSSQNWLVGASPSVFSNSNGVRFDDTATGSTNVTITNGGTAVQPAAVNFANNTKNYTLSGDPITSVGNLVVSGTGTVTINNTNSYGAGTIVNSGTLIIGATGSLGTGGLTVNSLNPDTGAAVAVTFNSAQTIGSLSGAIAVPISGVNTATITLNGGVTINQTQEGVYGGVIAGTGGLTKNGSQALTLTGSNTYTGPTIVNGGVLRSSAPDDNPKGALPTGQPVIVNSGATLLFGTDDGLGYYAGSVSTLTVNEGTVIVAPGTHSTLPPTTLNGGTVSSSDQGNFSNGSNLNYILDGDVTTLANAKSSTIDANSILLRKATSDGGPSAPVAFNVADGAAAKDAVVASVVKDQGSGLIKNGPGVLALTNSNVYTGPTVVNGGTLLVEDSNALGTGLLTISTGSVFALGADIINGFDGFANNGTATVDPDQVLTLTQSTNDQNGSSFSPTGVSVANGFTTSFVYTAGGNRAADGVTFTVQNSSPNALGGGGGQLGYQGIPNSASVQFNIYTGQNPPQPVGTAFGVGTTGQYIASAPVNLASGNPIAITLVYDPTAQTISETLVDLVTQGTYSNVFTNVDLPTVLTGTTGFVGFTGATGGLNALQTIQNFRFTNREQGVAVPNNIAVPAGATVGFDVIPTALGGAGAASLQGTLTLGNSATLNVTGGATATNAPYTLAANGATTISGNTTINVANNGTGGGIFTVGAVTDQAAGATLTKTGAGTLVILGAATYNGATNVNAGTLVVNGSLGGATTVNNGGTLGGTGTTLAVSVQSGGSIAPGNGIGTLTTGVLNFLGGSALSLEIGDLTGDQIKVNGAATLSGAISLALSLLADPVDNTVFTILDGTAPLVGYATGARLTYQGNALDESEQFTVDGLNFTQVFTISYTAGGGNDITLVAIPEPSIATLLLGAAGAMLGLKRRRK